MMEEVEELKYVIESFEAEGRVFKAVNNKENGARLFIVDNTFTDEQIDQVYQLCNGFFQQGHKQGILQTQRDTHMINGTTELIKAVVEQILEGKEEKEKED